MSDSINYGWVRLHRKLLQSDMWLSEPFTKGQAWIDLFANATHKESSFWVRGNLVRVGRGQVAMSKMTMSDRWVWSEGKVNRFLDYLKTEGQIEVQSDSKTTLITIVNYERYQNDVGTNRGTDGGQTADRQRTFKNVKNVKNTSVAIAPQEYTIKEEENTESRPKSVPKYKDARIAFSWFPSPEPSWYDNTTELKCGNLLFQRGEERVKKAIAYVEKHKEDENFNFVMVKPSDYERKWNNIAEYARRT